MYFILIDTRKYDETIRFIMNNELPGKVLFFDTYKDASELMSWYFLNTFPYRIVNVDDLFDIPIRIFKGGIK